MEAVQTFSSPANYVLCSSNRCFPKTLLVQDNRKRVTDNINSKSFSLFSKISTGRSHSHSRSRIISSTLSQTQSLKRRRRPENVPGEFYVDHTCIDCDTCRWMAPNTFSRIGCMSAVYEQPDSDEDRLGALQALISCPTNSIRTETPPSDILQVQKTFPIPVDEDRVPGVLHCGYHSEKSYGAASYLIIHPEGNILVDSPRYTQALANNIQMLGGARFMFLTHEDDVADHRKWADLLNCERVLHSKDVHASTIDVERKLEGTGPWNLYHDIVLIHTPGHTEGSVSLFHKSLKILFTGDHLAFGESGLTIFERYNKLSVSMQLNSVRNLLELDFQWILPGHGRRSVFKDFEEKNEILKAFLKSKRYK